MSYGIAHIISKYFSGKHLLFTEKKVTALVRKLGKYLDLLMLKRQTEMYHLRRCN
jgi:hypothetical protein